MLIRMLNRLGLWSTVAALTSIALVVTFGVTLGVCFAMGISPNWVLIGVVQVLLACASALIMVPYFKLFRYTHELEARLEDAASFDMLTGFYNRGVFAEMAASAWSLARRYERQMVVIMLEIDHFDEIRNEQGDGMVDAVLKAAGRLVNEQKRNSDFVGRWSESRSLMVLPDTPASGGLKFAERLQSAISRMKIVHKGSTVKVTASLGVSVYEPPERINGMKELTLRAERAMFHSIDSGRDRVMLYTRFTS